MAEVTSSGSSKSIDFPKGPRKPKWRYWGIVWAAIGGLAAVVIAVIAVGTFTASLLRPSIDNVDEDVDKLTTRFETLEKRVNEFDGTIKTIGKDVGYLRTDVDQLTKRVYSIDEKVRGLAEDVGFIKGQLSTRASATPAESPPTSSHAAVRVTTVKGPAVERSAR